MFNRLIKMSAYHVSQKSINQIASSIKTIKDNCDNYYGLKQAIKEIEKAEVDTTDAEEIAKRLDIQNKFSLREKYEDNAEDLIHSFTPKQELPLSDKVLYKRLSHYLYQSCEGDARTAQLYKGLKMLHNKLAHRLASRMTNEIEWK